MKQKALFLLVLILLFAGFVVARFFILDTQNSFGRVKIMSSPSAGVFIDNIAVGTTPYEDKLEVGEYMLKLIPEGVATDTASWQANIVVGKNTLTYVNRELGSSELTSAGEVLYVTQAESTSKKGKHGEIFVETEPTGAIVYIDNDEKGVSPLVISDVIGGDHELSVFMPGFFRRSQKINVDAGYRVNASFKLAVDQTQKRLEDVEEELREASDSAELDEEESENDTQLVEILSTPTGWLRVRSEPTIDSEEVTKVNPGETYPLLEELEGWYQIELEEGEGWISADFADKTSQAASTGEEADDTEEETEADAEENADEGEEETEQPF